jgi:hypothetical protein
MDGSVIRTECDDGMKSLSVNSPQKGAIYPFGLWHYTCGFINVNYIETKIIDIGKWFRAVDMYCCTLESVVDLTQRPMTALVAIRCQYHNDYSFEIVYGQSHDLEDSALIEQIASGIVNNRQ